MIDLSIIIVQYNNYQFTLDCIKSLLEYTKDVSFEIILVDNNSPKDGISKISAIFPDIIFIKNASNLGFGKANNIGLKKTQGRYVLLLNNDTLFYENTLKEILAFADSKKFNAFYGCKLLNRDLTLQNSFFDFPTVSNLISSYFFLYLLFPKNRRFNKFLQYQYNCTEISEVDIITGAFILGKREDFLTLNGFDERFYFYSEEMDLCYRFKSLGGKVYYYPNVGIIHYGGGSVESVQWFKYLNHNTSTIKFFQKHFHGKKFLIIILAHYLGTLLRLPLFSLAALIKKDRSLFYRAVFGAAALFFYPKNVFRKK